MENDRPLLDLLERVEIAPGQISLKIGAQLAETLRAHGHAGDTRARVVELLRTM